MLINPCHTLHVRHNLFTKGRLVVSRKLPLVVRLDQLEVLFVHLRHQNCLYQVQHPPFPLSVLHLVVHLKTEIVV